MPSGRPGGELRAEVPGGIIAGWQAGTGPAVLILHGGPGLGSILWHFEHQTLEHQLPTLRVPIVLVLGADSPIPPGHGIATAALIPGAQYTVEPDCGHFAWLERPGSVRQALARICR